MATSAAGLEQEDRAARAQALETARSWIVQAPAGAGKTELLTQRMLALLAEVDEPEAVVALTFTRKAAGEMRARVLEAIAAAADAAPAEAHKRTTWELARKVRARDQERGWELEQAPARLRIETLDALAQRLVGRMPWLSRWGGVPQPLENAAPLYRAAARALFGRIESGESGAEAARRLLLHLDADLRQGIKLMAGLLKQRDQWLALAGAVRGADASGLQALIEEEVRALVEPALEPLPELLGAGAEELVRLARTGAAGRRGTQSAPSALDACLDLASLPAVRLEELPRWRGLAEMALTKEGKPRQQARAELGLSAASDKESVRHLGLSAAAVAALHATRGLPRGEAPAEATLAVLELMPLAAAELEAVFGARGQCDFTAVTLAALRALGDADAPSGLAFALDGTLRHLLVDECQDTALAQFQLLLALTRGWEEGDGRTLFLVGDPMQSIYRFRNARLELFLRAVADGRLGGVELGRLRLRRNFRAAAELVAWGNEVFAPAFPGADDLEAGAARFEAAVAGRAGNVEAGVELHAFEDGPGAGAQEARAIAEVIEAEAAGTEIAILVQARRHVAEVLAELRRRGIRYQGVKLATLGESATVTDRLTLTRAVTNPEDRVAWLAMLRGPWCGLRLADLHALCGGRQQEHRSVTELWQERRGRLSEEGRARGGWVMEVLEQGARERGRGRLAPLVEWCWQRLGGADCADAATGEAEAFWGLLQEMEEAGGGLDLDEVAARVQELHAPPEAGAGARVQIMTVHEAKGLEFEVVILPGLARRPKSREKELLHWAERPVRARGAFGWLMAAHPRRGEMDELHEHLFERRKREEQHEQLRKLY
ncbi:MAG: UvrD-helicase domain-containing protein, partial [Terriglobales bacterium]